MSSIASSFGSFDRPPPEKRFRESLKQISCSLFAKCSQNNFFFNPPPNIVTSNFLLVHFYPSMNQLIKEDVNELNTTSINLKDFDFEIRLRETTENIGLSFRYNIHITKDIRMTNVKALWYYSTSTIFKISNEYQKFSQVVLLMMCAIIKIF